MAEQGFDYVIVGGGSAGCVLAARLSENASVRICLIEAGGKDTHPLIHVPVGFAKMTTGPLTWGLTTTPQRHANNREIAYAQRKASPYERYAARFAAKEAGMKALGTGWRDGITWHDLEVINLPSGRPTLQLQGRAAEIAAKLKVRNISLSITHTAQQAMAMVILED